MDDHKYLLDTINEALMVHRGFNELLYVNKKMLSLVGMDSVEDAFEHFTNKEAFLNFFHEDDRARVVENYAKRMSGSDEAFVSNDYRFKTGDNSCRLIEIVSKKIQWQGELAILANLTDVTELREAQAERRNGHEFLEEVLDTVPTAISISKFDNGIIKYVNDTILESLGYEKEEVLGKGSRDFGVWGSFDQSIFQEKLTCEKQVLDYRAKLKTKSGILKPFSINARVITSQEEPLILTAYIDRTAEVARNEALRKANEELIESHNETEKALMFLSNVLDYIGHGIFVTDANLRIISWNNTYIKLMGKSNKPLKKGMHIKDVLLEYAKSGYYGEGDPETLADERLSEIHLNLENTKYEDGIETILEDWETAEGQIIEIISRRMIDGTIIATFQNVTNKRLDDKKMRGQALCDGLTGLANRRAFDVHLEKVIKVAKEKEKGTILAMLDLDNFKAVNDTFGHAVGDATLKEAAIIIERNIRSTDFAARLGGDEFAVIFENTTNIEQAKVRLEKIIHDIIALRKVDGADITIGSSAGLCLAENGSLNEMALFERADAALYAAKEAGKGRVEVSL